MSEMCKHFQGSRLLYVYGCLCFKVEGLLDVLDVLDVGGPETMWVIRPDGLEWVSPRGWYASERKWAPQCLSSIIIEAQQELQFDAHFRLRLFATKSWIKATRSSVLEVYQPSVILAVWKTDQRMYESGYTSVLNTTREVVYDREKRMVVGEDQGTEDVWCYIMEM